MRQAANGFFSVNGTPTDCVHIAVTGLLDFVPDMVVSGINYGANMGDDTIYSGTVAAATERLPARHSVDRGVARDQDGTALTRPRRAIARELVERFQRAPIRQPVLLNVNVPERRRYAELRRRRGHAARQAP